MAIQRERRLVFGEDAERYDRARPSYPAALIDDVLGLAGVPGARAAPGVRVIDVGCGTAKGTRLLAERGVTGVGIEPHPAMAAVARRHLAPHPGWRVDVSDFEAWSPQPGDAPADLVVAAQSWHWIEPSVGLGKAHGLLRAGGWLATWWNVADHDGSAIRRDLDAVYAEVVPGEAIAPALDRNLGSPFAPRADRAGDDPDPAYPTFGQQIERLYRWTLTYTTAELVDLLGTHSNHRIMPPEQLARLLAAVAEVIDCHGGTYAHPYVSHLWAARRP